jgi:SH3-like domain-containing protein
MKKVILFFSLFCFDVFAYDLPKFISLKASEANVRSGPGLNFPVKWMLVSKNMPLEVSDIYENWYKVKDQDNKEGWLHKSLLSRKRYFVVTNSKVKLYRNPKYPPFSFFLEKNVRGRLLSCRDKWCKVKIGKIKGWLKKGDIWGAYQNEEI